MNPYLQDIKTKLSSMQENECWYIVKQDATFWKLCYLVQILKEYQELQSNTNFEEFVKNHTLTINKSLPNHRALRVALTYGLITMNPSAPYKEAQITEVFNEIKNRCSGIFESIESYQDIIDSQIEKIYCSSELDEKHIDLRKDYKLYPIFFLYKILLQLGISTGRFEITLDEFYYFVCTSNTYSEINKTLFAIELFRQDSTVFDDIKSDITIKFNTNNRFNKTLEQLSTIVISNDLIRLKSEYIDEIRERVLRFESYGTPPDSEYINFLTNPAFGIGHNVRKDDHMIGQNKIYFGAPGTGKSHKLNNDATEQFGVAGSGVHAGPYDTPHFSRVTFHSDYSYAQFVGTYKPSVFEENSGILLQDDIVSLFKQETDVNVIVQKLIDDMGYAMSEIGTIFGLMKRNISESDYALSGAQYPAWNTINTNLPTIKQMLKSRFIKIPESGDITYKFVPGPFIQTLVKALNAPDENWLLIIEEINRADAASVFGDVFQLLDRKHYGDYAGCSEYPVAASEDLQRYLKSALSHEGKVNLHKLLSENEEEAESDCSNIVIPPNMSIWATMNSADQGVYVIDTAFKRRWSFEYIKIDHNEKKIQDVWNNWRKAINNKLVGCGVEEDKLMGAYFLSNNLISKTSGSAQPISLTTESGKSSEFSEEFKNKVIMYLFEDAGRFYRTELFGRDEVTLSALFDRFDELVEYSKTNETDLSKVNILNVLLGKSSDEWMSKTNETESGASE